MTSAEVAGRPRSRVPCRRLVLAGLLGVATTGIGLVIGAAPAAAQTAEATLPRRMLRLELRHVEELAQGADGRSVVVHADGRIEGPASRDRAVDAQRSRQREHQRESLQSVLVLNGATAMVRLARATAWQFLEVQWSAVDGLQVAPATRWQLDADSVRVQPRWPGPGQPVIATLAVERRRDAPSADGGAPDGAGTLQWLTTVALPVGEWVTIARRDEASASTDPGAAMPASGTRVWRSGDAAPASTWVVQLRASLP